MKAWYFSNTDKKLRYNDGRIIEAGKVHTVRGEPELCNYGLHGSINILDALKYAPGPYIWHVDITRKLDIGEDKVCGQRRHYLWGLNAENILREFARKQALISIEKIKPYTSEYNLIKEYLETGNDQLRLAAEAAAEVAARSAAWSAARSAAEAAARSAARSSAEVAARSAAWSAAEVAARSAAWSAAETAWSAADDMLEEMIVREANSLGYV